MKMQRGTRRAYTFVQRRYFIMDLGGNTDKHEGAIYNTPSLTAPKADRFGPPMQRTQEAMPKDQGWDQLQRDRLDSDDLMTSARYVDKTGRSNQPIVTGGWGGYGVGWTNQEIDVQFNNRNPYSSQELLGGMWGEASHWQDSNRWRALKQWGEQGPRYTTRGQMQRGNFARLNTGVGHWGSLRIRDKRWCGPLDHNAVGWNAHWWKGANDHNRNDGTSLQYGSLTGGGFKMGSLGGGVGGEQAHRQSQYYDYDRWEDPSQSSLTRLQQRFKGGTGRMPPLDPDDPDHKLQRVLDRELCLEYEGFLIRFLRRIGLLRNEDVARTMRQWRPQVLYFGIFFGAVIFYGYASTIVTQAPDVWLLWGWTNHAGCYGTGQPGFQAYLTKNGAHMEQAGYGWMRNKNWWITHKTFHRNFAQSDREDRDKRLEVVSQMLDENQRFKEMDEDFRVSLLRAEMSSRGVDADKVQPAPLYRWQIPQPQPIEGIVGTTEEQAMLMQALQFQKA